MTNRILSASLAVVLLLPGLLFAHHSPSAIFDMKTRVPLKGSITKVDWINPHIVVYMDVKGGSRTGSSKAIRRDGLPRLA